MKNTTTVLAENVDTLGFNRTAQTLMTVAGEDPANFESTQKYLDLIGAAQYDKAFNDIVKQYESQFELASLDIQRQANIQAQDSLMQAGEGALGKLGSGAAADLQGDIIAEVGDLAASAQESLVSQYSERVATLETEYDKIMDTLLGETLTQYQENAKLFGEALFETLAENAGLKFETDIDMIKGLQDSGLIEQVGDTEVFQLTELGQTQITNILATYETEYGDYSSRLDTLTMKMAERVMAKMYPSLNPTDDANKYNEKLQALQLQFDEWLHDNSTTLYYTHLGLASMQNGNLVLNEVLETPPSDYMQSALPGVVGSGVNIYTISGEDYASLFGEKLDKGRGKKGQTDYVDGLIARMRSGDIPSGSYFFANYKGGKGGLQLFYFENDQIYATDYSYGNLPPELDPASLVLLADDTAGSGYASELPTDPRMNTDVNVIYSRPMTGLGGYQGSMTVASKTTILDLITDLANGKYPENCTIELAGQRYVYKNGKLIEE